jgi:long-chain acyl-CoA synthetase
MSNCTTFLDVNARLGEKPALVDPTSGTVYRYGELPGLVNRIAGGLCDGGVHKGDRVIIYLDSSPEYLLSYFAVWRIGAVAVPVNRVLTGAEVAYAVDDAGAKAIITDDRGAGTVIGMRAPAGNLEQIIVVGEGCDGTVRWADLLSRDRTMRAEHCGFDDLCQLQYTSGTTGSPKGAMLTHGNWIAAMDAERDVLGMTEADIYLGIYPMAHVGVSWGIAALRAGATWVNMERFALDDYIGLIEEHRATVVAGMPPVIHSLLGTPPGTEQRIASARVMISGGGPLHPSIWKEFYTRFLLPIVNAYGLSETIVVGTGTAIRPEHYATAEEFKSVGTPVGFSEVKIVNVADPAEELKPGETGEIALRGPSVATGYWKMPAETEAVFLSDGWFLTGDIGFIDGDGMLSITDRKKDMIVMSGWKIYPTEVEKVLIQHPRITDVAVFGIPDLHRGEVPVAAVVPQPGTSVTAEEIAEFCRERLAGYKVPRGMVTLEKLPRVHGWKLLRRDLREQYAKTAVD